MTPKGATTRCRSCQQPVRWVELPSGKRMPLDPEPSPQGNVVQRRHLRYEVVDLPEAQRLRAAGEALYVSHFVTCPQADTWRK